MSVLTYDTRRPPDRLATWKRAHTTGVLLRRLQDGESLGMPHSRPMPSIGPRCHELRIRDVGASWRIVYRPDPDAIVVLAVFEKSGRKTPGPVVHACKLRLRRYEEES